MSSEALNFPGQVVVDLVEIVSTNGVGFNIDGQFLNLDIYEDLFSPFITGTVTVYDSIDLMGLFPLVGEEVLNLRFHTPTVNRKHFRNQQFYIYKITDLESSSDRGNIYVLHFISMESVVDINTKISKTFSGKVSDIATTLLTSEHYLGTKKNITVEDSSNNTTFTANFWSPMKCINYITKMAKNSNYSPTYIFYENSQGLNFLSLEALYGGPTLHKFNQGVYDGDDLVKLYSSVSSLNSEELFDYIDRSQSGMYGSQLISIDPVLKKYSNINFSADETFDKFTHLNKNSVESSNSITRSYQAVLYKSKHYGLYDGTQDVSGARLIQQRRSSLKTSEAFRVSISAYGRTDYTVGQKVNMSVPAKEPVKEGEVPRLNKVLSGNYLISAIHHKVSKDIHHVDMELIKDSMISDLDRGGR